MIDLAYVVVVGGVFYILLYAFLSMVTSDGEAKPEVLGPLHLDSRDITTVVVIDFVTSLVLQHTVPFAITVASMFVLFVFSCWYVARMSNSRYKKDVEAVRRLFG